MKNYTLEIANDCVALITLNNRSFASFCEATEELSKKFGNCKIFNVQSLEKKGKPFQVLIVFGVFV